ncbi:hypothetical protein [uncultured Lamprocystis sp.]|jgi:hypothetical protein|uniref:hypothetical protein n=1 Tax=uncultured Lamprocystis sp. TaxID=543132 RepID=UPI0025E51D3D|nr:hypothetical protein [uncultured Lamprocystis sp.]
MSRFTPAVRTMRDIRTHADQPRAPQTAHGAYAQLFALQGERQRRQLERARALRRVANLDARCAVIDQDCGDLRHFLGTVTHLRGPRRRGLGG